MKKAVSLMTAAAMAAGTFGMITAEASPVDDGRYAYAKVNRPYLYFDVDESEAHTALSDNFIYINKDKIPEDGDVIFVAVYISDSTKKLSDLIVHLLERTGNIQLRKGYDPVELYGATPFLKYNEAGHPTYKPKTGHPNGMSISYQSTSLGYYPLTGENTDDYPIGCFDMAVAKDAPSGTYHVTHDKRYFDPDTNLFLGLSSSVLRIETDENDYFKKADDYEFAYQTPDIQINISDRDLGDINDNGHIDSGDAECMLGTYFNCENDKAFGTDAYTASDVNGDRVVDDTDAEIVMDYTLLYGNEEQPEVSFEDYVKDRIAEKAE